MTLCGNPRRLGHEALAAGLQPPEPINYLRFAEANLVFPPGEPRPGPYDRRAFVYFDEILRALGPDDPARIITLCASAQIGKTILGNVFALGSIVLGRGTAMIVHPSIENAARWSRMKLSPMMRSIPAVNALFPQRPRDAADARLLSIVLREQPWIGLDRESNSIISRNYKAEFKSAFYAIALMGRLSEPTNEIAFHTHVDRVNNLLRGNGHSEVEGDAVMAAIIAHGDIPWRAADAAYGQLVEVGIARYGSGAPCRNAWRDVLKGGPLRPSLPPRGLSALPSRPTPQVKIYQQDAVTGQMLRADDPRLRAQ